MPLLRNPNFSPMARPGPDSGKEHGGAVHQVVEAVKKSVWTKTPESLLQIQTRILGWKPSGFNVTTPDFWFGGPFW